MKSWDTPYHYVRRSMFSYDIVFDETIIMQISTKVEAIILVNALNGAFNLGKNYS